MSRAAAATAAPIHSRAGQTDSVEALIRRAHAALNAAGLRLSSAKVSYAARRYLAERGTHDFEAWFLTYADPTGETAVRKIMAASR
jgi:hypothetical protein